MAGQAGGEAPAAATPTGRLLRFAAQVAGRPSPATGHAAPQQLDLFAEVEVGQAGAPASQPRHEMLAPRQLTDAALLAAIPDARPSTCQALAQEAVRRQLRGAVPALEAMCSRHRGFGLQRALPEQVAAVQALAAIGGALAADALRRIIVGGAIAQPGLPAAVHAAATLRCILPQDTAAALLRHPNPAVRADACRCTPRSPTTVVLLVDLLQDLNPPVAIAAVVALARMGRADGRPWLLRRLHDAPDLAAIDALAAIADEDDLVLLGRIARQYPALREAAMAALAGTDLPRAAAILSGLCRADTTAPATQLPHAMP